jgi:hypothetical protein
MDGYEALVSELRATAPVAPERLRERVLELAPAARTPMNRRRRLVFVVVPAAVVLAVGAALVHGFVSSGSNPRSSMAPTLNAGHGTPASAHGSFQKTATVQHEAVSGTRTKNNGLDLAAGRKNTSAFGTAAPPGTVVIPKHRLVHATASLEVQVRNRSKLSQATNKAIRIVGSLGGYAQSVHYEATHHGYGTALLALRVPVQNAQVAIARLGGLGVLLQQQVSTKDLQTRLTHETSQIGSLKSAIAVYEQALQGSLPASQRVIIQIRLNNARRELAQLRHARKGTLRSGATADISLVLDTPNHAIVVTHHRNGRLGRLLGSAAHFLALEGIIVLYALVVAGPILLIGALGWWIARERRRRDERLLAGA